MRVVCAIVLLLLCFRSYAEKVKNICKTIHIHSEKKIDFSDDEERLVCGDQASDAYRNIPEYQASYFLQSFLQSRGYLDPKFETKGNELHVYVGDLHYLKHERATSEYPDEATAVETHTKKLFRRKLMTPKLLDTIEGEGLSVLRQRGFPCAEVKGKAFIEEDTVELSLLKLNFETFGEVKKEEISGVRGRALDRFYPFKASDPFNEKLLKLTEKRMLRQSFVQGTYFLDNCEARPTEKFQLRQEFIPGPPRTIRFGFGASTELGPMARAQWSNNRYKKSASTLSAQIQASLRNQTLSLSADSYLWKNRPRRSVLSTLSLARDSQIKYEQVTTNFSPHLKWTKDHKTHAWLWTVGPTFEAGTFHSKETSDTNSYKTVSLVGGIQRMHHDYEFFDVNPEEGDLFNFTYDLRHPSLGFNDPLAKLDTSYVKLSRLSSWGRGWLVGGARVMAATTWVSPDVNIGSLPPSVKFYGGGSNDIRGYFLNTLPRNDGLGALTKLGSKLELRRTYFFHPRVEVFSFIDGSYFGERSWTLSRRFWYTPGVGLRWLSPIGLVQGYAARALALNPNDDFGNFFYVGFGGIF